MDLECGVPFLPKGEYAENGSLTKATPKRGNEFCLVETKWSKVGDAEAGGATVLGSLEGGGEQITHENKDVSWGIAVMEQRDMLPEDAFVQAGKSFSQVDVYEVPTGAVPDGVWISRDQLKVLAAL